MKADRKQKQTNAEQMKKMNILKVILLILPLRVSATTKTNLFETLAKQV